MINQEWLVIIGFGLLLILLTATSSSKKSSRDAWNKRINGKLMSDYYTDKSENGFDRFRKFQLAGIAFIWVIYICVVIQFLA